MRLGLPRADRNFSPSFQGNQGPRQRIATVEGSEPNSLRVRLELFGAAPKGARASASTGRFLGVGRRRLRHKKETPWSPSSKPSWRAGHVLRQRISNNSPLLLLEVQQAESRMVSQYVSQTTSTRGLWSRRQAAYLVPVHLDRYELDGFGRGLIRRGCHVPVHEMHPCHDWL